MSRKRFKTEEIVNKLREADVLTAETLETQNRSRQEQ